MTITAHTDGRTASISAGLFALSLFGTVASVNVSNDLAWWQEAANRSSGTISAFFAVGAAVLFGILLTHLTYGTTSAWLATARTLGIAVVAGLLVSAALRGVIAHLTDHEQLPLPSADVLNYSTALNHMLLNVPVMAALALTIGAISVTNLRATPWLGYVGLVCAIVVLAAVGLQIGAYAIPAVLLWALCQAVALWHSTSSDQA
ncbi:hypothetical protein FXN61_21165 [Lentzea sp. PSKA42]|uniref:DUF4386 family protein n=1 Tax=Lentzea indica TaxID=2604800 RepID=A0ABX1FJM2_9PSEU|nr:hypothetical protein [Lentzea indica]NKE59189.1 hypothetical protein [Lentzea indica]